LWPSVKISFKTLIAGIEIMTIYTRIYGYCRFITFSLFALVLHLLLLFVPLPCFFFSVVIHKRVLFGLDCQFSELYASLAAFRVSAILYYYVFKFIISRWINWCWWWWWKGSTGVVVVGTADRNVRDPLPSLPAGFIGRVTHSAGLCLLVRAERLRWQFLSLAAGDLSRQWERETSASVRRRDSDDGWRRSHGFGEYTAVRSLAVRCFNVSVLSTAPTVSGILYGLSRGRSRHR